MIVTESDLYEKKDSPDVSIRPADLTEFIGQKDVISNLKVYLEAARLRNEPLDHVLLSGPPGLGKTSLARIIAEKQKGAFSSIAAPAIKRPGDIAKLLTGLGEHDILFIDEIHRLTLPVEETLYSAMEDRQLDISMGEGMGAATVRIDLPPFTLVGATTKPGNLTGPLRDRFGIHLRLDFYQEDEIAEILRRAAKKWTITCEEAALTAISTRSRRTPRVALRLLRRIRDFAMVAGGHGIDKATTEKSFYEMNIDSLGLTSLDNEFLRVLAVHYHGGPVGLKPLSAALAEDVMTLEDFVEPFLIRLNLIQRTSRGRVITTSGYEHLGIPGKKQISGGSQMTLLSDDGSGH